LFLQGIYYCDVTGSDGIFPSDANVPPADVIIASLVFDVVALSKETFAAAIQNVR
jgi:hypothetical protein